MCRLGWLAMDGATYAERPGKTEKLAFTRHRL
jgi:hypothetical protein